MYHRLVPAGAMDARKARAIVKSRDISYAFTNVMAHK